MLQMAGPECQVCDGTEYALRDGEYFCIVCNTQSQQLGTEKVMDDDTVPGGFGMCDRTYTSTSSKGKTKSEIHRRKQLCDVGLRIILLQYLDLSLTQVVRWSSAEGFSRILRGWVTQLKTINIDVEVAVIQLWTLYLRLIPK